MKRVVSERCPLCGGRKQPGKTTYSVDLGSGVILVRVCQRQYMCSVENRGLTTTRLKSWSSSPRKPGRKAGKSKSWLFKAKALFDLLP